MNKWLYVILIAFVIVIASVFLFLGLPEPQEQSAPSVEQTPQVIAPNPVRQFGTAETIDIRVSRAGFSPSRIEVEQGKDVVLRIRSTDGLEHGFVLRAYGVEEVLFPGDVVIVPLTLHAAGSFRYFSNVPSFPGAGSLEGFLIVS